MELRLIIAYTLLALLVAFTAGMFLWWHHNSQDRTIARSRRREKEASLVRMAERDRVER
jgi:uncharacterized iron-regulated membrane protein